MMSNKKNKITKIWNNFKEEVIWAFKGSINYFKERTFTEVLVDLMLISILIILIGSLIFGVYCEIQSDIEKKEYCSTFKNMSIEEFNRTAKIEDLNYCEFFK
jgi:hypothetical protein